MNELPACYIKVVDSPQVVKNMRQLLKYYQQDYNTWKSSRLYTRRHFDEYWAIVGDYVIMLNRPAMIGLFYRYHHHRYFKHHRPRKLRKAK